MGGLADAFPDDIKKQFIDRNLKIGSVIRMIVPDTLPKPKIKRLIIVGADKDSVTFASVYINTEINGNVISDELLPLQFAISTNDRPYLENDSFVDCSKLKARSAEELSAALSDNPAIHIGNVSDKDMTEILSRLHSADTISPKQKARFGL